MAGLGHRNGSVDSVMVSYSAVRILRCEFGFVSVVMSRKLRSLKEGWH